MRSPPVDGGRRSARHVQRPSGSWWALYSTLRRTELSSGSLRNDRVCWTISSSDSNMSRDAKSVMSALRSGVDPGDTSTSTTRRNRSGRWPAIAMVVSPPIDIPTITSGRTDSSTGATSRAMSLGR